MPPESAPRRFVVDRGRLPASYPTHRHSAAFWEALGRTVATFGFLEEVLGRAIFAFMATREIPADQIEEAYAEWIPTLERALTDPLGNLIDAYGKWVRQNDDATITDLDALLDDLRAAARLRNVLCHGSWRAPDSAGRSVPHYVEKRSKQVFDTAINIPWLEQMQKGVLNLACAVIESVTHMGWQFPGSAGPGAVIMAPLRQAKRV